jgi:hypothetical protein
MTKWTTLHARILVNTPLRADCIPEEECIRMAEVTIQVPVTSKEKDIRLEGYSLDDILGAVRKYLPPLA